MVSKTIISCLFIFGFLLILYYFIISSNFLIKSNNFALITDEYKNENTTLPTDFQLFKNILRVNIKNDSNSLRFNNFLTNFSTICPLTPPNLIGPITVWMDNIGFDNISSLYPELENGGHGYPKNCISRHRVAIIIPFRDRKLHLSILLHNLHYILKKQQIDYGIFVIEQTISETFNRAKLMNVGFEKAKKVYDWQCYIFHDVDLIPENDKNIYSCSDLPRHMSVEIDKFNYKIPYNTIFGGITSIKKEQFIKMNGFSNNYWGWGGEDDDMSLRVKLAGYNISRYPSSIARYKMINHSKEAGNPINKCRFKMLKKVKNLWKTDGLVNLNYKLLNTDINKIFTKFTVDLLENESRKNLDNEIC